MGFLYVSSFLTKRAIIAHIYIRSLERRNQHANESSYSPRPQVPVPLNLIVMSSLILYIGCHHSLRLRDKTSLEASEVRRWPLGILGLS